MTVHSNSLTFGRVGKAVHTSLVAFYCQRARRPTVSDPASGLRWISGFRFAVRTPTLSPHARIRVVITTRFFPRPATIDKGTSPLGPELALASLRSLLSALPPSPRNDFTACRQVKRHAHAGATAIHVTTRSRRSKAWTRSFVSLRLSTVHIYTLSSPFLF